jgi:hypothetical protein
MTKNNFVLLNQLLESVSINIDDVSVEIGLTNLNLMVDSLICRDISVGNIAISHSTYANDCTSTNIIDVDISLNGIDVACDIEFEYEYGSLKGTAKAEIVTVGNAADTSIEIVTKNEDGVFVVTSSVTNCVLDIKTSDVNFIDANFVSSVVASSVGGFFKEPTRDLIEKEIEKYACSQLSTTGATHFPTLEDTGAADYDETKVINFLKIEDGDTLEKALSGLDQFFGSESGNDDELGINNFLRSFLDENGALVLNIAGLPLNGAPSFELHDKLT